MKKRVCLCLVMMFVCVLTACGKAEKTDRGETTIQTEEKLITVGFSQLGAESDWRNENTESMKDSLSREKGYELIFEDGQQKQANQIMAIRTFIQQEVDYIVLAPVTEDGWDTVLKEAKDAGIPVIIVDRMVDVKDDSLFTCFVGSDFELEGNKMAEWLAAYTTAMGMAASEVQVVNIQGNLGATAQIGRTRGIETGAEKYGWNLLEEVPGDFTQTKGKEVMASFLKKYPQVNVVYCENDNEAFGAIEAIEEAGRKVGGNIADGEIMVLSFDGVSKDALDFVSKGKISCIAECNPLHGPRVSAIIEQLEQGKIPDKLLYVDEGMYAYDGIIKNISVNQVSYSVTQIR